MKWKLHGVFFALLPESPAEIQFLTQLIDILDADIVPGDFSGRDSNVISRYYKEVYDPSFSALKLTEHPTELWLTFQERFTKFVEKEVKVFD